VRGPNRLKQDERVDDVKRAIIVDDERLARRRVRRLLELSRKVEVIGECRNGQEAVGAIRSKLVDVVFLDVQMPVVDGFGVIEAVGPEEMPAVVFVTAYEEYAIRAFEANALDYLVKPIDEGRLRETLARLDQPVVDLHRRLLALLRDHHPHGSLERFVVRDGERLIMVPVEEVDFVGSEGNYVRLHAGNRAYLLRETMGRLDAGLDPECFVRIHRSTIVRVDRIRELLPSPRGKLALKLRDGKRLEVSRRYRPRLERFLGRWR
jgi:two-component system LytT family response regulator